MCIAYKKSAFSFLNNIYNFLKVVLSPLGWNLLIRTRGGGGGGGGGGLSFTGRLSWVAGGALRVSSITWCVQFIGHKH